VRKLFRWLQSRYGPRYAGVMLTAAFVTLFLPVPGLLVVCVALIVAAAEVHRAVARVGGLPLACGALGVVILAQRFRRAAAAVIWLTGDGRAEPKEVVMPVKCDVIVGWGATPEQLTAVGAALWRWCVRGAEAGGIYQYLDNQALADLIAGRLPVSDRTAGPADRRGVHFRAWDRVSPDGRAAIEALRRELPAAGVVDVLVNGTSWAPAGSDQRPRAPV
jgi:hypothetical protein